MVTSTESAPLPVEELEQKITAQVEYYFDDLNLKHDKFIKYHMRQDDGWFPIEKLMTFNRLKSLTTDQEMVVKCIRNSTSGLVELNEDGSKLRRSKPIAEYSEEYIKELNHRTLHLKGFPKDSKLDDIMAFCAEFGKVQSVQMRRNFKKNNEFKGCIMVTYLNKEDAEKALETDPLKYNDIELLKENKEKYFERKKIFYESLKEKRSSEDGNVVRTKGAILKITGLRKDTKFSDIKEELSKHSKVAFVSNVNDESECNVRFAVENGAKEVLKALKEKTEVKSEEKEEGKEEEEEVEVDKVSTELFGQKVELALVGDEEEKQFWREFKQQSSSSQKRGQKSFKWQKGKKRPNTSEGEEKANKATKVADAGDE